MFAFFILSIFNSIYWERSLAVTFYLFVFIMVGLNLFMILIKNPELREKIIKIFLISSLVNICFIFFYSILFIDPLDTVKKFKGFLNIICITVFLLSFFNNEKKYFLPIILIPSSLHINYSYSPCLGIILGTLACIIYFLKKKSLSKKNI
jgi:amino acid transporter